MKKFKYFPYFFLVVLALCIFTQKLLLYIHLMPSGGLSWSEIWMRMPIYIILSALISLFSSYITSNFVQQNLSNVDIAKKRKIEREKFKSPPYVHECRVCGCYSENFPWGDDGKSPSYQICSCCGVQFGKGDVSLEEIKMYRTQWINHGCKWLKEDTKGKNWNLTHQITKIPDDFK